ncbi:hypothetical protein ACFVSK_02005 [Cellulosimicrobium cellulans]|uniref:hypothetical protein n=1 Tax=Cellulosimicrobium cellulans TaxID=1710 RepID=UPI0036E20E23
MTRNRVAAALAAALTLTALAVPATTAAAAPAATATDPVGLERDADGTPLVRLTGRVTPDDAVLVDGSLLGEVVVVPGDSGRAVLRVRNEGPTAGTLTASVVDAVAHRDPGGAGWTDDAFYDDLTVNGVSASRLEGRRTVVHEAELGRGATVDVPVVYDLPVDATTGNRVLVGERVFSFDLLLRITGDAPGPGTGAASETPAGTADDAAHETGGLVSRTGGVVEPGLAPWWAAVAGGLVLVAAGAVRTLRRGPGGARR